MKIFGDVVDRKYDMMRYKAWCGKGSIRTKCMAQSIFLILFNILQFIYC